jgi:hypothetical protein
MVRKLAHFLFHLKQPKEMKRQLGIRPHGQQCLNIGLELQIHPITNLKAVIRAFGIGKILHA